MLAEPIIAGHGSHMKRLVSALLVVAVAAIPTACRQQPQGALKAVVIGDQPKLRDPALGPLPPSDAVLLENVAQGLVSFDASGNIVSAASTNGSRRRAAEALRTGKGSPAPPACAADAG